MTGVDPAALLARLTSGVTSPERAGVEPVRPSDGVFSGLLERARGGQLSSGRGVEIAPDVLAEFSPDQMQRLADAADRAQAAGAEQALVQIDGVLVRMDVASRTITAEVDPQHGDVLTGFDAFVEASDPTGASSAPAGLVPLPGNLGENASLVKELAKLLAG